MTEHSQPVRMSFCAPSWFLSDASRQNTGFSSSVRCHSAISRGMRKPFLAPKGVLNMIGAVQTASAPSPSSTKLLARREDTIRPRSMSQRSSMSLQLVKTLITNNELLVMYSDGQQAVHTQMEDSNCFYCCVLRNHANYAASKIFLEPFSLHEFSNFVESSGRVTQNAE